MIKIESLSINYEIHLLCHNDLINNEGGDFLINKIYLLTHQKNNLILRSKDCILNNPKAYCFIIFCRWHHLLHIEEVGIIPLEAEAVEEYLLPKYLLIMRFSIW